ncbi:MAG: peptidoglycan-associated lipoprotein Pal [Bdellovibrionales bacterium]|jgi:peptidoglycan-associated lipoprotein|nr:peptidoglycan-associated lipoprotein Pal [Bdellovibrionales bacterium]
MQQDSQQRLVRSTSFVALCLLLVMTVASCTKPKRADGEGGAEGFADGAPAVIDQDMSFDPQGSDSGNIAGLETVYFAYDRAALTETAKRALRGNAQWINANPRVTIQIEGHTDARGSTEYNLSLGERRAKSVRQYLEELGVESRRLTIISYGEEKPLAHGDTEASYSKNRRANFVPLQ